MLHKLSDASRGFWPARARRFSDSRQRQLLGTARMEAHGGLTALYLSGSPYEMGYQQGALAQGLVHAYRRAAYDYVLPQVPGPKRLARPLLFHYASGYWPTIPAELRQEISGIADGAGIHPIEVLVSAAIWEILLVSGCSEFAAVGPATADGSLVHGYNYDLMRPEHALIQPYLAAIFFRPEQGIPFVTVNTVGSVGANAGMNEAGISVAWDNTYLRDNELFQDMALPVVPFIITLRRLLQYARTLHEAVTIVTRSLPRPLADIVIIGSAPEGRAVAVETAGYRFAVRAMDDGTIWSTNCFRSAELAAYDRRGDGRGLAAALTWQSFPRHLAYRALFAANHGRLDAHLAAEVELLDTYLGSGYAHPTPAARQSVRLLRDTEGLELETTYTGKAMAALLDYARLNPGTKLLFVDTFAEAPALGQGDYQSLPERFWGVFEPSHSMSCHCLRGWRDPGFCWKPQRRRGFSKEQVVK